MQYGTCSGWAQLQHLNIRVLAVHTLLMHSTCSALVAAPDAPHAVQVLSRYSSGIHWLVEEIKGVISRWDPGPVPQDAVIECDIQPDGWMSHSITSSAAYSCGILIMHTIGHATPSSTEPHNLPPRTMSAVQADPRGGEE